MLKKFKGFYQKLFRSRVRRHQAAMEIENHSVEIESAQYYVSRALITDIPEMLTIERSVYAGKTPWDRNAFATEIRRASGRLYLVMRHEDRLVAFCGCSFDERRHDAHITNIAVLTEFQNRGLGHFLMQAMIKRAKFLGYRTVTLEVRYSNVNAQRMYQSLGFEKTGIKKHYYFGDHEDAIDMTLQIPAAGTKD